MRLVYWLLIGLTACEFINASMDGTSVKTSGDDGGREQVTGTKKKRISSNGRRRKTTNSNRRARSRLAKSCGGQVGSVLLEEWYRFCQVVFTGSVEGIDRERGTIRVTMRRVIRSLVSDNEWPVLSSLINQQRKNQSGPSNDLNPLPVVSNSSRPTVILHDLLDARQNSCVPQFRIRVHDVLLFLVQIHPLNQTLQLVSAPLRITLRNLRLIHTSPESPTGKLLHRLSSPNWLRNENGRFGHYGNEIDPYRKHGTLKTHEILFLFSFFFVFFLEKGIRTVSRWSSFPSRV